jgi:GLPGLI family protein
VLKCLIFSIVFFQFTILSFSQLKEGVMEYVIDVQAVDTSLKAKQQAGLLRNSNMKVYFMAGKSRIDFKMGEMFNIKITIDQEKNRALSLFTTPKGNFASKAEATKLSESKAPADTNLAVELSKETKTILGYSCKKAILRSGVNEYIYWYTENIQINLKGQALVNANIPGFPLEFQTVSEGVFMHFKIANIEKRVADKAATFSTLIPKGYTVLSNIE